jgi:D-sedoheptulose 7-phosphate isomerase
LKKSEKEIKVSFQDEIRGEIEESLSVKNLILKECVEDIEKAVNILIEAIRGKKTIYLCGNGGSASDCQHIACELVGRIRKRSISVSALSLAANISVITALSNDFGYEHVFSKQLGVYAEKGDVLIAISTSGTSLNVLKAVELALKRGVKTIVMAGKNRTPMTEDSDVAIRVPSEDTPKIQEGHIMIGHIFATLIERTLCK